MESDLTQPPAPAPVPPPPAVVAPPAPSPKKNPAIKAPPASQAPPAPAPALPPAVNEDGFVPGEEVPSEDVLLHERARAQKERAAKK